MASGYPIVNNTHLMRFETEINGDFAFVEYRYYKGAMALMHTFVPESARGKGASTALAKFALDYVRDNELKLLVYCPFVTEYMKRHPEYNHLLVRREEL